MFGTNDKLDQIIALLKELCEKSDQEINYAEKQKENSRGTHLKWLQSQIEFYENLALKEFLEEEDEEGGEKK